MKNTSSNRYTPAQALKRPAVVYRHVSLSVEAFDRLKDWQRHWEATEGQRHTNGVLLDRLILAQRLPQPKQ